MIRQCDLGLIDFADALRLQEETVSEILSGTGAETLFLLEHPEVYTLGSGGDSGNIIDPSVTAVRTNRGGEVTFHGPGQLVGYPLLRLDRRGRDLHRYLRFLEAVIVDVAGEFGVRAGKISGLTGVWTEKGKLAAIGVGVRRWVTMHGFALNIVNDLSPFEKIVPCGLPGCRVTSLARETGCAIEMPEVKRAVSKNFISLAHRLLPIEDS